jgi:hypothetical protein
MPSAPLKLPADLSARPRRLSKALLLALFWLEATPL